MRTLCPYLVPLVACLGFALSSCQVAPGPGSYQAGAPPRQNPAVSQSGIVRGQPLNGVASYIVVETRTRKILAQGNASDKRPVASLTKVATALVALDWQKLTGQSLDRRIVIPPTAAQEVMGGANPLGMRPGDQISLRDALYASLMASDNVAAEAIADYVGRDLLRRRAMAGDPVERFVTQMNALAERLGMKRTEFTNPHGLDHYRKKGHSTAADMARLAIYATDSPALRFYTSQGRREVTIYRGGTQAQKLRVNNTNEIVGREGIDGLKTGMTQLAGPCFIVSASKDPIIDSVNGRTRVTPRRLVVVVLGAQDRFGLSTYLLRQGWGQYESWFRAGMPVPDRAELLPHFD